MTKSKRYYKPTHRITIRDCKSGETIDTIDVMLCADDSGDGPAYTADEYDSCDTADWAVDGGKWLFQGRATPGNHQTVEVARLVSRGEGRTMRYKIMNRVSGADLGTFEAASAAEAIAAMDREAGYASREAAAAACGQSVDEATAELDVRELDVREVKPGAQWREIWSRDKWEIYGALDVTLRDGREVVIGAVVGVQEWQRGTCEAAQSGVAPFLSAWYADSTDWEESCAPGSDEIEAALSVVNEHRNNLWSEADE